MPRLVLLALASCLLASSLPSAAAAQEWTRFRGPNGSGISEATTVPTEFGEDDYNWRVRLPGIGHSCPVIWGDRVFITSANPADATQHLQCLSAADGSTIWQRDYPSHSHTKHERNSFASSTPAVDAERVYVCWSTPEEYTFAALDHDGNEVWQRNLGPYVSQHSSGTSPIVYEDMVILGNDQDGPSFLVAVDAATGEDRWRTPRRADKVAYSTPCVYQGADGKPQLIFNASSHGISGHDPESGETLWELGVFTLRSCSSPVVAGDVILGSCGSGQGGNYVVGVRPPRDGRPAELAYKVEGKVPYVPTTITNGNLVFLWEDKGVVTCISGADGKIVWRNRVDGNFSGSPIRIGKHLYCISDDGDCFVIEAGPQFKLVARNPLGEMSRSTPAVSDGVLYLRTEGFLISVGGKATSPTAAAE